MTAIANDRLPPIHCTAEWHLRETPRAALIYTLALRLTKGGKTDFYLSQGQLSKYFGWDVKSTRSAFRALERSGLLVLLRSGKGGNGYANFASVYKVIP